MNALKVPSVAINGETFIRTVMKPLSQPATSPTPRPAASATDASASAFSSLAATMPARAATGAIERSIAAATITSASPAAKMAMIELCSKMLTRFVVLRKTGEAIAKPAQIRSQKARIPY